MCVYTYFVFQVFFLEHYFYQTNKSIYFFKKRILACFVILADGTNKVPEKVRFKERMREW